MVVVCRPFVLFSAPRSGSTWVCQVLDAQPNTHCGLPWQNEMMNRFGVPSLQMHNRTHADVDWAEWSGTFHRAMGTLRRHAGCQTSATTPSTATATAIGFKLMPEQLPDHLVPHFIELVAECNVTMLHVVREAAVLRLASLTAAASSNIFHTASDSVANAERRQPLMWQSGEAVGTAIRELEELNGAWQVRLSLHPRIRYLYASYESLLSPALRDGYFAEMVRFVGAAGALASPLSVLKKGFVPLHESSCEERVHRWEQLAAHLVGTRTEAACAMLAGRPLRALPSGLGHGTAFYRLLNSRRVWRGPVVPLLVRGAEGGDGAQAHPRKFRFSR